MGTIKKCIIGNQEKGLFFIEARSIKDDLFGKGSKIAKIRIHIMTISDVLL